MLSPQIYGQAAIGLAVTLRPCACEVVCSGPPRAVTSFLHFFCFRARLARKRERNDPRVDFYSTPSRITILNSLNLEFRK